MLSPVSPLVCLLLTSLCLSSPWTLVLGPFPSGNHTPQMWLRPPRLCLKAILARSHNWVCFLALTFPNRFQVLSEQGLNSVYLVFLTVPARGKNLQKLCNTLVLVADWSLLKKIRQASIKKYCMHFIWGQVGLCNGDFVCIGHYCYFFHFCFFFLLYAFISFIFLKSLSRAPVLFLQAIRLLDLKKL